jgi:hypothetical protein
MVHGAWCRVQGAGCRVQGAAAHPSLGGWAGGHEQKHLEGSALRRRGRHGCASLIARVSSVPARSRGRGADAGFARVGCQRVVFRWPCAHCSLAEVTTRSSSAPPDVKERVTQENSQMGTISRVLCGSLLDIIDDDVFPRHLRRAVCCDVWSKRVTKTTLTLRLT